MASTDENVRLLSNAVLSDVRGDAEKMLADARAKAEEIRSRAGTGRGRRAPYLAQASGGACPAASAHTAKARTLGSKRQLESVFDAAHNKSSIRRAATRSQRDC
jgi:hypothetical protein